jgi:hypothetical protein
MRDARLTPLSPNAGSPIYTTDKYLHPHFDHRNKFRTIDICSPVVQSVASSFNVSSLPFSNQTMSEWQSSYFLEDRSKPLHPKNASLNTSLQTQYIDLDDSDDSMFANITRAISACVGSLCTPKQVLGLLRLLKAVTLSFLVLSILANLMFILFVQILSTDAVKEAAGGHRDVVLRLYGLGLSLLGLAIELDYSKLVKKVSGLKGFLPRAALYFFISQITASHPTFLRFSNAARNSNSQAYNSGSQGDDDDAVDENAGDDAYNAAVAQYAAAAEAMDDFPSSAIGFQRVTSIVL